MKISKLQKILLGILCVLLAMVLCLDGTIYAAFYHNPYNFHYTYQVWQDSRIPSSMDNVSIVYLTDLEYDDDFGNVKADELFDKIAAMNPDILIFGGDLFNQNYEVSDDVRGWMLHWLSIVDAPLGKFAVYGEQDLISEERKALVDGLYAESEFEVLDNRSLFASNQSKQGIRIGGLTINGDAAAATDGFNSEQFCLLIAHWPDNLIDVSNQGYAVSHALCGNSHGTQIMWPFFGGYKLFEGSTQINRANLQKLNFPYEISNGLGCLDIQARLNSASEVLYITLKSA